VPRRTIVRLLVALSILLVQATALAQYTRDKAAQKMVDQAINEHYLATNFDKALEVLTGTIKACGDKCSPAMIGKLWMYVGIVKGSGKADVKGAQEAFAQAVAADPGVKLDDALATDEVKEAFKAAGGTGVAGVAAPPVEKPDAEAPGPGGAPAGGLDCTPEGGPVQTRRAIPVSCKAEAPATSADIRYLQPGGEWQTVRMPKKGGYFQGSVPCEATGQAGPLKLYVQAKDEAGDIVDTYGTKSNPVQFSLAETAIEEPPAFPGQDPPARCEATEECPPDFPGCAGDVRCGSQDWGGACSSSAECKCGLLCTGGTCETAPSCSSDAECEVGICHPKLKKCSVPGGGSAGGGVPFKRHWVGLHVAQDIAFIGGSDVCVAAQQAEHSFACFYADTEFGYVPPVDNGAQYPAGHYGEPYPGSGIATGAALATTRFLASYDFAFTEHLTAGVRAGFAIGGGPPAGETSFLPLHLEVRGTYWITSLANAGLRPYVHAGGGVAQVDAKVQIDVLECGFFIGDDTKFNDCVNARGTARDELIAQRDAALAAGLPREEIERFAPTLDVYKKMGQSFVTGGGGLVYAITPSLGVQLNVNAMLMFTSIGFVIEPSLGMVMGL
jgi:hypothetical protein